MLGIILTAIITATITAIVVASWRGKARGQGDASIFITTILLIEEVNSMAEELGYKDIRDYWLNKKGEQYAKNGMTNLKNAMNYINEIKGSIK